MKRLFFLLALLPFLCTCDRAEIAPYEPYSITWELKEALVSPGSIGEWQPVESDRYLRFENGRVYTNGFGNTGPENGETEVALDYNPDEQVIYEPTEGAPGSVVEYRYSFDASLNTLTVPISPFCVEPCLKRYHRPAGE